MLLKNFFKILGPTVRHRATIAAFQEVRIPVPWGHIAGKWYGPTNKRPILSLHGWQDNCGTFNRLIPLLNKDLSFLAIDLPGHGLSSRLPDGMYYHISNYILVVDYLVNYFKWPKSSFLGHSLGGIVCFTYNLLHPDKVDFLICLDSEPPLINWIASTVWSKSMREFWKHNMNAMKTDEPPSYTMEEILQKVSVSLFSSVDIKYAHHIAERNILPSKIHPGKYYFSRDPRLKSLDVTLPPFKEMARLSKEITSGLLMINITTSSDYIDDDDGWDQVWQAMKRCKESTFMHLKSTHHGHLNEPEKMAPFINDFIIKHFEEDIINFNQEIVKS